jgi:CDP-diacylglycerol--glycerol-3-phosphate 3-phosphatidyltransferase
MAQARLSTRRLLGLDRSGPPPLETRRGQPLRPWTIPNLVGYCRLALIPVFLAVGLTSGDGRSTTAAVIYAVIGATDYLDGILARATGQYSRLGVLLDPLVDRLLVVSGVVVAWRFELLPRWALALLIARELAMLILSRVALDRGLDISVSMVGRWAVWPTMFSIFLSMLSDTLVAPALLILGVVLSYWATAISIRDARRLGVR